MTVEDGTGLEDANSYVSLEEANEYNALRGNTWTGTDSEKEAALIRATSYLDGTYGSVWPGYRSSSHQALDWPRTDAYDKDGYLLDGVPTAVAVATIEAAVVEAQTPGTLTSPVERVTTMEKVGPITVQYSNDKSPITTYPSIRSVLSRIIGGALSLRRG